MSVGQSRSCVLKLRCIADCPSQVNSYGCCQLILGKGNNMNCSIFCHMVCSKKQPLTVALINLITNCLEILMLNRLFFYRIQLMKKIGMYLFSGQCKNFNDWFSSTQLSLKDCFDPSETKPILEERLQRLKVKYLNVLISIADCSSSLSFLHRKLFLGMCSPTKSL